MISHFRRRSVPFFLTVIQAVSSHGASGSTLSKSTSSFLSHYSSSPVGWREWGDQILELAQSKQTPILVVSGFSYCGRCDAAFGEIFNAVELADLINLSFLPILVDGDAHPDFHRFSLKIMQSVAGSATVPFTIVFTPDLKPIWAASDPNKTELLRNLQNIQRGWQSAQRQDLLRSSEQLYKKYLQQHRPVKAKERPVETQLLRSFFREMAIKFDPEMGGFQSTSKLIPAMQLMALNRIYRRTNKPEALEMVEKTLREIKAGSIHDHVEGGFFRKGGERGWIPDHFAKVLSDNALIASAFLDAWKITSNSEYSAATLKTLRFMTEHLRHKSGGFFSALIDRSLSSGQSRYTWNYSDLKSSLSAAQFQLLSKVFIKDNQPGSTHKLDSVARTSTPIYLHSDAASYPAIGSPEQKELDKILAQLRILRQKRNPAALDHSIQIGWNGLTIEVLSRASRTFAQTEFLKAAVAAAEKIKKIAWDGSNLSHLIVNDKPIGNATLEDYTHLIHGLFALGEATGQLNWLDFAAQLQARQIEVFWSEEFSAFFDFQNPITKDGLRIISLNDADVPSGNAMAVFNLIRLANLSGNSAWKAKAEKMLGSISSKIIAHPGWYPFYMQAVDASTDLYKELVIVAPRNEDLALEQAIFSTHFSQYAPNQLLLFRLDQKTTPNDSIASELLKAKRPIKGKTTFYVCQNRTCKLPTTDVNKALEMLRTSVSYKVGKD